MNEFNVFLSKIHRTFMNTHWRQTGLNSMGASIKYNYGAGQKKGYTYVDDFGAGQKNCGCKCTHCTHKFGAIVNTILTERVEEIE